MKTVRCAIYTRKSSDEGLDQAFNSLHAQRDACAAYILSQASEGWSALPQVYDDGGLSGGTLERPALQRLLADVSAGLVDIIVVYKVDRLTRSLLDFAKLVELFDKAGTSFVSITQSFNTTTSMGRLTLNMLLSFAQFEREVTAERIRDKIAASKAKGMWMGGTPPLGYTPHGRTLVIVEEEAALVRDLFRRYLDLGTVSRLERHLAEERIASPVRHRTSGTAFGGRPFSRGQLYALLRNPVYVGRIVHGQQSFPGLHPPLLDEGQWQAAQDRLADNRQGDERRPRASAPALLAGKLHDEAGEPLLSTHACKGERRYRYYVAKALQQARTGDGWRIPARELELAVAERLAAAFDDPLDLARRASLPLVPASLDALATRAGTVAARLRARDAATVRALVAGVTLNTHGITIACDGAGVGTAVGLERAPAAPATFELELAVTLARTGRAVRLVQASGAAVLPRHDPALVRLVVRARRWWSQLREGALDVGELAASEGVQPSYVTRVLRLAFLSPQVTQAILAGTVRAGVDGAALTRTGAVVPCWREQARSLLAATVNA